MAYIGNSGRIGQVDLTTVATTLGTPGTSQLPSSPLEPQLGEIAGGWDPNLGGGEFMYVKAAGAITAGNVVELAYSLASGYLTITATPWTGTAISGKPLGVAMATMAAGNFAWIQVEGAAVTTTNGAITVGNPVYWQANGTVSNTGVVSKQMVNAVAASLISSTIGQGNSAVVLSATQALVFLQRPFAQGAIT
jgi:hypothetical protein